MSPEFLYQVLMTLISGAAVYGGIRADLRTQRESIARAHVRLDNHIEGHK